MNIYIYVSTSIYLNIYVCMCMYIYMYVCMYVWMYVCILCSIYSHLPPLRGEGNQFLEGQALWDSWSTSGPGTKG